jgi:predicted acetyltransferase
MDVAVRQLHPGEAAAFVRSVRVPFLDPSSDDTDGRHTDDRAVAHLEADRAWVAVDEGRFVGNAGIYSLDLTLPARPGEPGSVIPFAGVTAVGVHPTHRRRGLLRQLMARMLEDSRRRGEAFAGLFASESAIYGRFGFGQASSATELTIDSARSRFLVRAPELGLRLLDRGEAAQLLPALFDRQRRLRAGETSRSAEVWQDYLEDRPFRRHGAGGLFIAGCDDGFVAYRAEPADFMRAAYARVFIEELRGMTPDVEAALWRFVFDLDLAGQVVAKRRPIDEPLRWRLADARQLRVASVDDRLHVRILDVPAAFEARGYRRAGRVVFDVLPPSDDLDGQPDPVPGRWLLEAGPDGASCRAARGHEATELRLGATELGALYLGGVPASELAAAGRIDELRDGSLDRVDALLAAQPAPLTGTAF